MGLEWDFRIEGIRVPFRVERFRVKKKCDFNSHSKKRHSKPRFRVGLEWVYLEWD